MSRVWHGFGILWSGWHGLRQNRRLRRWAIVPMLLSLALLMAGWTWGIGQVSDWTTAAIGMTITLSEGFWYSLLYYFLVLTLGAGFLLLWLFLIFMIYSVIAAPFNSFLAEECLAIRGAKVIVSDRWSTRLSRAGSLLFQSVLKAIGFACLGVIVFVMSFVPGLNIVALFLTLMVMAFDSMDYSFEAMEWGLKERWRFFRKHLPEFAGMALALALTLFVPGLTLLSLPVAVVGASHLFVDLKGQ